MFWSARTRKINKKGVNGKMTCYFQIDAEGKFSLGHEGDFESLKKSIEADKAEAIRKVEEGLKAHQDTLEKLEAETPTGKKEILEQELKVAKLHVLIYTHEQELERLKGWDPKKEAKIYALEKVEL
jgi:hypothetical protein